MKYKRIPVNSQKRLNLTITKSELELLGVKVDDKEEVKIKKVIEGKELVIRIKKASKLRK